MSDEPIDHGIEGTKDGISRRRMLKRIGIVSAVAWTTPVVTSLRTPAFAQTISTGGCSCFADCGDTPGCSPSDCFCVTSVEGASFCSQNFTCGQTNTCEQSSDCPDGWICQGGDCPGGCGSVCVPPCGTCAGDSGLSPIGLAAARTNRG